jgi:hypothetical protein
MTRVWSFEWVFYFGFRRVNRQMHSRLSIHCKCSKTCHPSTIICIYFSTQINKLTSTLQSISLIGSWSSWNFSQWNTSKHHTTQYIWTALSEITPIFPVPTPTVSTDLSQTTTVPNDQDRYFYPYLIPQHNFKHFDKNYQCHLQKTP